VLAYQPHHHHTPHLPTIYCPLSTAYYYLLCTRYTALAAVTGRPPSSAAPSLGRSQVRIWPVDKVSTRTHHAAYQSHATMHVLDGFNRNRNAATTPSGSHCLAWFLRPSARARNRALSQSRTLANNVRCSLAENFSAP
jgi:hypothetical protein